MLNRFLWVATTLALTATSSCRCNELLPSRCSTDGSGTIAVTFLGLPSGVTGTIHLSGPSAQTVTSSATLNVGAGSWVVEAERATASDPLVRTVYRPTVSSTDFCLAHGATQNLTVTWSRVETSNALWALNANATGQFLGFRSTSLQSSATVEPQVNARGALGGDIAFDADGNVWVAGPTTVDAALNRFTVASFAMSGAVEPEVKIDLAGSACLPLVGALAFDPVGNLYVSSPCRNAVLKVTSAQLARSGPVTPVLSISVEDPGGLAFDRSGNLWVAARADERVWRYDASQLADGSVSTPALKVGALASTNPADTSLLSPTWLAFDAVGRLWANSFGGNAFFYWAPTQLVGTGVSDAQPPVKVVVGVTGVLEGFAFDDQGGLWSAGSQGKIVRLSPSQLTVSSSSGAPTQPDTVLESSAIGSAGNIAFYPAAAGLPLFHSLP